MRVSYDYRTSSIEAYNDFCKKNPNICISYSLFKEIIYTFNEDFRNYLLETGDEGRLPSGLGEFYIHKKKRKKYKVNPEGREFNNLPIDWVKTRQKGKIIFNMNYHTEGYFFGWYWNKSSARLSNVAFWYFKPSRVTSRLLAHYLKTNEKYQHLYRQNMKL